jgi:hypothetical protein
MMYQNFLLISVAAFAVAGCTEVAQNNGTSHVTESALGGSKTKAKVPDVSPADECRASLVGKRVEYENRMLEGSYWDAVLLLGQCSVILNDPEIKKLVEVAEIKHAEAGINDSRLDVMERIRLVEVMERDYPDDAKKFLVLKTKLIVISKSNDRAREARDRQSGAVGRAEQAIKSAAEICHWKGKMLATMATARDDGVSTQNVVSHVYSQVSKGGIKRKEIEGYVDAVYSKRNVSSDDFYKLGEVTCLQSFNK